MANTKFADTLSTRIITILLRELKKKLYIGSHIALDDISLTIT